MVLFVRSFVPGFGYRLGLGVALFLGAGGAGGQTAKPVAAIHVYEHENVLGTSMDLKVRTTSDAEADRAEAAVLTEIDRENKILSAWSADSEFSKWEKTHGTAEKVSPELFQVLALFDVWRMKTGGALDASAETAVRAWKLAAAEQRKPTIDELAAAVATMQRPHWQLDAEQQTAKHLDNAPIALNSFAKSFIAGHAADAAMAAGATGVLLNIGGDIVVRGAITERVAIANPRADAENDAPMDLVRIANRTIATSGSYRRGVEIGGTHFSHIIDPRTGEAVDGVLSSTVVAADPSEAGALATAFSVMTPMESRKLAASLGGVEYLLLLRNGETVASPGWSRLEVPRVVAASYSPSSGGAYAATIAAKAKSVAAAKPPAVPLDLLVTLELARIDDPRYRRPYVSVWIDDADRYPVRTLALWFGKRRWLPELKGWYRDDQARTTAEGTDLSTTISSATRPPGKYTLRWDGKDNAGKMLKLGKYTINIEVAREHGGYDLLHQEISFDGKTAAQFELSGHQELAGVQMDYGRHAQ